MCYPTCNTFNRYKFTNFNSEYIGINSNQHVISKPDLPRKYNRIVTKVVKRDFIIFTHQQDPLKAIRRKVVIYTIISFKNLCNNRFKQTYLLPGKTP